MQILSGGTKKNKMNFLISFLLPAKASVTEKQIRNIINTWVKNSEFYSFEDLDIENAGDFFTAICKEAELAFVHHFYPKRDTEYIATKLMKNDKILKYNRVWKAYLIFSHNRQNNKKQFHILLCRGIHEDGRLSDMNEFPTMPDITNLLVDSDLLDTDAGIPISLKPHRLKDLYPIIQTLYISETTPELPVVFVNCHNNSDLEQFVEHFIQRRSCMAHYVIIKSEEELNFLRNLRGKDHPVPEIEVMFKKININKSFSMPKTKDEEEMLSIFISYYLNQCSLSDEMSWDRLMAHYHESKKTTSDNTQQESKPEGYYILNKEMANTIKSLRKKSGYSQIELAEMADTTGLIISRIETLRITRIKKVLLSKLEEIFKVDPGAIAKLENFEIPEQTKEAPIKAPIETSAETPIKTPIEMQKETQKEMPAKLFKEVFKETPKNEPKKELFAVASDTPVYMVDNSRTMQPVINNKSQVKVSFCPLCGTKLMEGSNFCHLCGARMK